MFSAIVTIYFNVTRVLPHHIGTAVGDTMNEFYVPRKRVKSFQSTDSLDKWRECDAIDEGEGMELTGTYIGF
jgi:hypothetical protein